MRLINTYTRDFCEFFDANIPQYTILSHRWGPIADEVSYLDYLTSFVLDRPGYFKIDNFCRIALSLGYQWAWVDTCCIDKTSSAELTEAINSMFSWYKKGHMCMAYLHDVNGINDRHAFGQSSWFTRGWTLQELLAPPLVSFYTSDWQFMGTKNSHWATDISSVTGIPQRVLKSPEILHDVSVARRLSWAAGRETSRVEDMAYCLLGLFDVNMPLLYGEGMKAFHRLQLHIMEQLEDDSLFAWMGQSSAPASAMHGLLAKSPDAFADCGNLVCIQTPSTISSPPIRLTSRGAELFVDLSETQATTAGGQPIFLYTLNCGAATDDSAYLDMRVGGDVLKSQKVTRCSIALTRKGDKEAFTRINVAQPPSGLSSMYQHVAYVRPDRFYIRTTWSGAAAFTKVYGSDRVQPVSDSVSNNRYRNQTSHGFNTGDPTPRARFNLNDLATTQ